jgi:hypothetical protein
MSRVVMLLAISTTLLGAGNVYLFCQLRGERAQQPTASGAEDMPGPQSEREPQESNCTRNHAVTFDSAAPLLWERGGAGAGPGNCPCDSGALAAVRAALSRSQRSREVPAEYQAMQARQRYGQLFRELELSDAQIDGLAPVLHAQEQRALATASASGEQARSGASQRHASDEERSEIAAIIGPEKAAQLEDLRNAMPIRAELRRVRDQLEEAGEPVSPEQQRQLVAILSNRAAPSPPVPEAGEPPEHGFERFRAWARDRDLRLRADSAAVLTPQQLERLEESEALRSVMLPQAENSALATRGSAAGVGG